MAKPINHRIGIMIPGSSVPAAEAGVGTELHHPERKRGTREGMAVSIRPDKGIHIGCRFLKFLLFLAGGQDYDKCNQDKKRKTPGQVVFV
jgi:hypothetical protein